MHGNTTPSGRFAARLITMELDATEATALRHVFESEAAWFDKCAAKPEPGEEPALDRADAAKARAVIPAIDAGALTWPRDDLYRILRSAVDESSDADDRWFVVQGCASVLRRLAA